MNKDTKNNFAPVSTAFSNRDGEDWPRCIVAGCSGIIKIIFDLISGKNKQKQKFEKLAIFFGVPIKCCIFVPGFGCEPNRPGGFRVNYFLLWYILKLERFMNAGASATMIAFGLTP